MTLPLTSANVSTMKLNMIRYNYQNNAKLQTKLLVTARKYSLGKITFICDRAIIKFCKGGV